MKRITKKVIVTMLVISMLISAMSNVATKTAYAASKNEKLSSKHLNSSEKYLYLGGKGAKTYNFNINKKAQEKGSKYTWYVKEDKGNSKSVTINKKSGLVSAK